MSDDSFWYQHSLKRGLIQQPPWEYRHWSIDSLVAHKACVIATIGCYFPHEWDPQRSTSFSSQGEWICSKNPYFRHEYPWVIWHRLWITDVRTKKSGYDTWCPGALFHVISAKYSVARNVIRHKEIDRSGRDAIRCLSSNRVSHSGPRYGPLKRPKSLKVSQKIQ